MRELVAALLLHVCVCKGLRAQQLHLGVTERRHVVRSDQRHPVARGEARAVASVQVRGAGPHAHTVHQVRRSPVVHADVGALHTRAEVAAHVVARLAAAHDAAPRAVVGGGGHMRFAHQAAGAREAPVVRLHARVVLREDAIAATHLTTASPPAVRRELEQSPSCKGLWCRSCVPRFAQCLP